MGFGDPAHMRTAAGVIASQGSETCGNAVPNKTGRLVVVVIEERNLKHILLVYYWVSDIMSI